MATIGNLSISRVPLPCFYSSTSGSVGKKLSGSCYKLSNISICRYMEFYAQNQECSILDQVFYAQNHEWFILDQVFYVQNQECFILDQVFYAGNQECFILDQVLYVQNQECFILDQVFYAQNQECFILTEPVTSCPTINILFKMT